MSVGVVHLVRHGNPDAWLANFIASYRAFDAGMSHDIVMILKGCSAATDISAQIAGALPQARFIEVDDTGFDINAYRHAAGEIGHDRVCFLNSHARIEGPGWLGHLAAALDDPGTGAVGASGSWEIMDAATPFPNDHLRTNGFMMARAEFLALDFGPLASKRDCNRFEAGPQSLTWQLRRGGREVVVVGRDGQRFSRDAWPDSQTFRGGEQQNLMISDNRSRVYARAWSGKRRRLAAQAWGARARPARKRLVEALAERLGL